jgi:hypothetical protein
MTHSIKVKARLIICTSLALIDHAVQLSWSGYAIIAEYNGIQYPLYSDKTGDMHVALMRVIAPSIEYTDTVEVSDRKYFPLAQALSNEWPAFESYPVIEIDPNDMVNELQWAYGL